MPLPFAANSILQGGKTWFDKAWKATDKYIGEPSNKLAGKLGIEGFWPTTMDKECDKCARILRVFTLDAPTDEELLKSLNVQDSDAKKKTQKVIKKIPPQVIENAKGLAIFTVFRTGFGWSAASGSGIVIARNEKGEWAAPSGILIHTIGVGLLIGADIYDVVLILNTEAAVNSFVNPRVNLGAELAVVAGPVGNGFMGEVGYKQMPCYSYTKSKGLYAGVQLDGTVILERGDENERFYGVRYSAKEILSGKVYAPLAATGLLQTVKAAQGSNTSTDKIPRGLAPSEEVTELSDELKNPKFGVAPPSYTDLEETPEIKCTYCGIALSINDVAEHACESPLEPSRPASQELEGLIVKRKSAPQLPSRSTQTTPERRKLPPLPQDRVIESTVDESLDTPEQDFHESSLEDVKLDDLKLDSPNSAQFKHHSTEKVSLEVSRASLETPRKVSLETPVEAPLEELAPQTMASPEFREVSLEEHVPAEHSTTLEQNSQRNSVASQVLNSQRNSVASEVVSEYAPPLPRSRSTDSFKSSKSTQQ